MPRSLLSFTPANETVRLFGLRFEKHLLQVAIATPVDDRRY